MPKIVDDMSTPAPRILVVDDNVINLRILVLMLSRLGYSADTASNGIEALRSLERQSYDLVFMDIQMPELDGISATQIIRKRSSARERPRIIAVTAFADKADRTMCIDAGMDEYMCKPIKLDELRAAIESSSIEPDMSFD